MLTPRLAARKALAARGPGAAGARWCSTRLTKTQSLAQNLLLEPSPEDRGAIAEAVLREWPQQETLERATTALHAWSSSVPDASSSRVDAWPAENPMTFKVGKFEVTTPTSRQVIARVKAVLPKAQHDALDKVVDAALAKRRDEMLKEELMLRNMANHDLREARERLREAEAAVEKHRATLPSDGSPQLLHAWTAKLSELTAQRFDALLAVAVVQAGAELHLRRLKDDSKKSSFYGAVLWGLRNSWAVVSLSLLATCNFCLWLYHLLQYLFGISIGYRVSQTLKKVNAIGSSVEEARAGVAKQGDRLALLERQVQELRAERCVVAVSHEATPHEAPVPVVVVKKAALAAGPSIQEEAALVDPWVEVRKALVQLVLHLWATCVRWRSRAAVARFAFLPSGGLPTLARPSDHICFV